MLLGDARQAVLAGMARGRLLLAGILHEQGRDKVDGFSRLLDDLDEAAAGRPGPLLRTAGGGAPGPGPLKYDRVGPPLPGLARRGDGHFRPERSAACRSRRASRPPTPWARRATRGWTTPRRLLGDDPRRPVRDGCPVEGREASRTTTRKRLR